MSACEILIVVMRLMVEISVMADRIIKNVSSAYLHIEFPECTTITTNDSWHFAMADRCDSGRLPLRELLPLWRNWPSKLPNSVKKCNITVIQGHHFPYHLHSLRGFWRHCGLCRAAAHRDCCFFRAVYNYFYLLTYLLTNRNPACDFLYENNSKRLTSYRAPFQRYGLADHWSTFRCRQTAHLSLTQSFGVNR